MIFLKDNNKKNTGNIIKVIRKDLGLTMKEFGEQFSPVASDSIVSRWEKGKSLPNNQRLKKIAELGNVSVEYLLYGYTDLQGNDMPLPRFFDYKHELLDTLSLRKKERDLNYSVTLAKISNDDKEFYSLIRTTHVFNGSKLLELYFENNYGEFDLDNFAKKNESIFEDNFSVEKNTLPNKEQQVDINKVLKDKKSHDKEYQRTFFNELANEVTNEIAIKKYYVDERNKVIKIN